MLGSRVIRPGTWTFTALMGLLTALAALGIDLLLPALPLLVDDLHMSPNAAQLSIGLFMISYSIGQIFWGWLADWIGRRPVLIVGTLGYGLLSLLCAFAPSGGALLALRLAHGLFAAAGTTVVRTVIRDHFTGVAAARQIAAVMTIFFLTPMLAPQLGSLLLLIGSWRILFWLPALAAFAAGLIVIFAFPESQRPTDRRRASLLEIGATWGAIAGHPVSGLALAAVGSLSVGIFTWISLSSLVLTGPFGIKPEFFGLFFIATASSQIIGANLCNRLLAFVAPTRLLRAGALVNAMGGAMVFGFTHGLPGGLWPTMAGMLLFMLGFGLVIPNISAIALQPFRAAGGLASALIGTTQSAMASFGSFLAAFLFNGTSSALGEGIAIAVIAAFATSLMLARRLDHRPDFLDEREG